MVHARDITRSGGQPLIQLAKRGGTSGLRVQQLPIEQGCHELRVCRGTPAIVRPCFLLPTCRVDFLCLAVTV